MRHGCRCAGAELRGVNLAEVAADDAAYRAVRAAFERHSVLLFRGQQVSDDIQLAFSRRFGPLEITKVGSQGYGTNLNAAQKLLAELLTAATAPGASYLH